MKTAGLVLGIIGGTLSIIFAFIFFFSATMFGIFSNSVTSYPGYDSPFEFESDPWDPGADFDWDTDWDTDWDSSGDRDWDNDFNFAPDSGFDISGSGSYNPAGIVSAGLGAAFVALLLAGIAGLIGGILGIIGGAIIRKKRIASGVLLLIAAVLSVFTGLGFIASILLIIACVFAFIREQPQNTPPAAPQTYPPSNAMPPVPPPPAAPPTPPAPGQWPQP